MIFPKKFLSLSIKVRPLRNDGSVLLKDYGVPVGFGASFYMRKALCDERFYDFIRINIDYPRGDEISSSLEVVADIVRHTDYDIRDNIRDREIVFAARQVYIHKQVGYLAAYIFAAVVSGVFARDSDRDGVDIAGKALGGAELGRAD